MIAIQNSATGDVQVVAAMDGYDPALWLVLADPAPADLGDVPYLVQGGVLVPDLAALRLAQRAIISAGRDAAISAGAPTPFGVFDSDLDSRGKINGGVTMALMQAAVGAPYEVSWTLADDSAVTLTGPQMMQAGGAVALHVDAMHQRSRVLKGRIEDATTVAEVRAVLWTLEDEA